MEQDRDFRSVKDIKDLVEALMKTLDALDIGKSSDADIDAYLDARDQDPFDSDWNAAYQELESRKRGLDKKTLRELESANEQLRERVFKRVLALAGDDAAGYISDDFGLMLDALAMDDMDASWIFGLYERYASAALPSGSIPARPRPVLK